MSDDTRDVFISYAHADADWVRTLLKICTIRNSRYSSTNGISWQAMFWSTSWTRAFLRAETAS
jgi:hypothetical protein